MGSTDRYRGNSFNIQSICPAVTCYVLKPLYAKHMVYGLSFRMLWIAHLWRQDFKMFLRLGHLSKHSSSLLLGTLKQWSLSPSLSANEPGRPGASMAHMLQRKSYSPSRVHFLENIEHWAELMFIYQECDFSKEKKHSESSCGWSASCLYQGIWSSTYTAVLCI